MYFSRLLTIALPILVMLGCDGENGAIDDSVIQNLLEANGATAIVSGRVSKETDDLLAKGEEALDGLTVYADLNSNGLPDQGEPTTQTNSKGEYVLVLNSTGEVQIRQIPSFGWRSLAEGSQSSLSKVVTNSPEPETIISEYSFAVAIRGENPETTDGSFNFCSAVMLTDRWGLSAGHCDIENHNNLRAYIGVPEGVTLIDSSSIDASSIPIKKIIRHSDFHLVNVEGAVPGMSREEEIAVFNEFFKDDLPRAEIVADIMLFELSDPIDLNASGIYTVGIADKNPESQTIATNNGYGASDESFTQVGTLKENHLLVQSSEYCEEHNPRPFNESTQVCAAIPEGGVGGCFGDSGSPLIVKNNLGTSWELVGITSYGSSSCGTATRKDSPSFFMSVPFYKNWVEENAVEEHGVKTIDITSNAINTQVNFINQPTTRTLVSVNLKDRYQINTFTAAQTDTGLLNLDFSILNEGIDDSNLLCEISYFTPYFYEFELPCSNGLNVFESEEPLPAGLYQPTLRISSGSSNVTYTADALTLGDVQFTDVTGDISFDDATEFGRWSDSAYFDFYTLEQPAQSGSNAINILLSVSLSSDFEPLIGLLDLDMLATVDDPVDAIIQRGSNAFPSEIIFQSLPSKRFGIVILPYNQGDAGSYTLTLSSGLIASPKDTVQDLISQ